MSGKGDNPRPFSVTQEVFHEHFDAIDWHARDRAELKALVEQGMADGGHTGSAEVESRADELVCHFTRADGLTCDVAFGGRATAKRSVADLAAIGVRRMSEWYDLQTTTADESI